MLRDDGTLWLNCGSRYANKNMISSYDKPPILFKPKDLIPLDWLLALALQADGWYLRSSIVLVKGIDWTDAEREAQEQIRAALALVRAQAEGSLWGLDKGLERAIAKAEKAVDRLVMSGAVMPGSQKDRPTSSYEMMFLFSKEKRYYYDHHAIRVDFADERMGCDGSAKKSERNRGGRTDGFTKPNNIDPSGNGGRSARDVWRIPVENSPSGGYQLPDGRAISHFASFPQALAARAILAATSEAGCCATCAAPWERAVEVIRIKRTCGGPSPKQASINEGGVQSSGLVNNTLPVTKTLAWTPTCRCHGDPLPADVSCPKCNGTALEHIYPRGNEPYKAQVLPGRSPGSINTDHDGRDFAKPHPMDNHCPACLCPDCEGTGKGRTSAPRQADHFPDDGQRESGKRGVVANVGQNSMVETDVPCPTCNGLGATGRVNGETWPDDVLENWPRKPCVVLDPMAGTAQTGRAALDLGRSVILNDLSPEYCALMYARLSVWPDDLSGPKKPIEEEIECLHSENLVLF